MARRSNRCDAQPAIRFGLSLTLTILALSSAQQNAWAGQAAPTAPQSTKPACEPATAQPLAFGKTIDGELAGNQCTFYRFVLPAKVYARAVVDQRGIDVTVAIFEEGKPISISEVDRPTGSQGPESISWITVTDGTYFLRVGALQADAPRGSYTVRLDKARAPE